MPCVQARWRRALVRTTAHFEVQLTSTTATPSPTSSRFLPKSESVPQVLSLACCEHSQGAIGRRQGTVSDARGERNTARNVRNRPSLSRTVRMQQGRKGG